MKLYKSNLMLFLKNKLCSITYIVINVAMILTSLIPLIKVDFSFDTVLLKEENLVMFDSIIFIMFLFLSFIYFSKAKNCDLVECISTTKKGKNSFLFSQFLVVTTFAVITFIISFLLSIFISLRFGIKENQFVLYLLKTCFFYFFLSDIIAILIGLICSFINSKTVSYIILFIFAILFSPISNNIPNMLFMTTGKNMFPFFDLFEIYPTNFRTINHAYGYAANLNSIYTILFWIFLCSLIVFLVCCFRIKWIKVVAVLLSAFMLFSPVRYLFNPHPHSEAPHNLDPVKGFCSEAWHYLPSDVSKSPMQYNEKADFSVTSYFIGLYINKDYESVIHMDIDNQYLEEYKFTLYRGFEITDIANGKGEQLQFERDGDYVTVHRHKDTKRTNLITFTIRGISPMFYTNSQGAYLPAGFPFYPISGFHYLYDIQRQGRIGIKLDKSVPITVQVDSDKELFCSLDKVEDAPPLGNDFSRQVQIYKGVADSVTVVDGFYKEITVDDTRLIYKYLDTTEATEENIREVLKNYLEEYPQYKGKTIILSPESHSSSNDENRFEASDHIVASNLSCAFKGLTGESDKNILNNYLDLYYRFLTYYDKNSELYKLTTKDISELPQEDDNLDVILAKLIIKLGPEEAYIKVVNSFNDMSSDDNLIDFAKTLYEK